MPVSTDADLLARSRDDASAFRELYDRYAVRIHGYHLRRSGDPDAAQDLAAETFAQAWFARARFRDDADGSAGPWLFGIARNVLLASVRRRRLERGACERLGLLDRIDRPTADQRDAIRMRIVEDLSYSAAAARLDATPQTVRARVSRGLRTLRTRLDATGGDR
jgi:DNA-directed RNA polymerase specialized sigma24 family protein